MPRKTTLIRPDQSAVLLLNAQHRLLPWVDSPRKIVGNCGLLLRAAGGLSAPVLAFERDPDRHGPTVNELAELVPDGMTASGSQFSAYDHPTVKDWLLAGRRPQVVICGIETHVALLHTALGLIDDEYDVYVPADATATRGGLQMATALARLREAGARVVTTEMVLYEWAAGAGPEAAAIIEDLLS
jgi:nicotinamidase-related amidase